MSILRLKFYKGHGTGNDFVLLPDFEGALTLHEKVIQAITDRHRGIGADGVLRVVRTKHAEEEQVRLLADRAEWFMDYRNQDGSKAEMCGNGVRVFAKFLVDEGLVEGDFVIATRAGLRRVRQSPEGFEVEMGRAELLPSSNLQVDLAGQRWQAIGVLMPNPHAVAFVPALDSLSKVLAQPTASPSETFPQGANFEFVEVVGERHLRMRVFERGVGETLSCGTGACAVAYAARIRANVADGVESLWQVDVPGGTLKVTERADGEMLLSGPAELVADGAIEVKAVD